MTLRAGVDVGGTFTDVVTVEDGAVRVEKTASTPAAPEEAVVDGLGAALEEPGAVSVLAHGTTVATNAALEGEYPETALVTTEGFRDVLEIGRQDRPDIYDLGATKPDPIVPRDRRYTVPERVGERGAVREPLDEAAVSELSAELADAESVAICLLFAYENDAHERRVADLLDVDAPVSLSTRVLPEIREYERTATTALNAALRPVVEGYLDRLEAGVGELGVDADLTVMQSNGGVTTAADAGRRPVTTLLSGPAAGVAGATHVAGEHGFTELVTMDMGGTSCDVALVEDGSPLVTTETEVGDHPVGVPAIDIETVGAGGGSVAYVDDGGALRVGPRSAGAEPGPVCYGRGGQRPTVTDAHYLLGRLSAESLLPAAPADEGAVEAAIETVADPLDLSVEAAARGILSVADANTVRALRVVSVERGHDPRGYTLVAFGGAGPLHAASVAAELGMARVLVPPAAGTLSALGLLAGDLVAEESRSRVRPLAAVDTESLSATFAELADRGRDRLPGVSTVERFLDLRYSGQSFELRVPVDAADRPALEAAADRFHRRHRERYGHAAPDEPLELVTARVRVSRAVEPPTLAPAGTGGDPGAARTAVRSVGFADGRRETPVYDRGGLPAGGTVAGPAVVEGAGSTVVVPPEDRASVADDGSLVLEVGS